MSSDAEHPSASTAHIERFLELLRRELLGCDVVLVDDETDRDGSERRVVRPLPGGRRLVVELGPEAPSLGAIERRLEVLVECFAHTLESQIPDASVTPRPPVALSLQRELQALAGRLQAIDAVVIDIDSPVLWCSAVAGPLPERPPVPDNTPELRNALTLLSKSRAEIYSLFEGAVIEPPPADADEPSASPSEPQPALPDATRRAVDAVHRHGELKPLYKGGRARHHLQEEGVDVMARVFADIYVLLLISDVEVGVDEILAERAITGALPQIERLVLAMPPLDPTPERPGRAMSMRKR